MSPNAARRVSLKRPGSGAKPLDNEVTHAASGGGLAYACRAPSKSAANDRFQPVSPVNLEIRVNSFVTLAVLPRFGTARSGFFLRFSSFSFRAFHLPDRSLQHFFGHLNCLTTPCNAHLARCKSSRGLCNRPFAHQTASRSLCKSLRELCRRPFAHSNCLTSPL